MTLTYLDSMALASQIYDNCKKSSEKLNRMKQTSRLKLDPNMVEQEIIMLKNRETFGNSYWKNSKYTSRHIKKSHSVENSKKSNGMQQKRYINCTY